MLHHPAYRAKYEINLKREFPRLPFYENFPQWAAWGRQLMELHLGYEQAPPFPLERHDRKDPTTERGCVRSTSRSSPEGASGSDFFQSVEQGSAAAAGPADTAALRTQSEAKPALKPRLKALKETGTIEIDAVTTLHGIPVEAWDYKLGNRSGLEWVLDQWKEHKISDPTVAEKFNTYRFADHKEAVIALLARVCTVSVETMKIVRAMPS